VLSLPVVAALTGSESGRLTLAVSSAGSWTNGAVWTAVFGDGPWTRILDTPAVFAIQFGVVGLYGLLGIWRRARRRNLSDPQREAAAIAALVVLLVTLVRPPVGTPNNLFARPMILVWALLACFAADAWREPGRRWIRRTGLLVCAGGTLLAVAGATAEGALFWPTPVDTVEAARWINSQTPGDAIVAAPPSRPNLGYWLWRRTLIADRRHALLFGATPDMYDDVARRLGEAYRAGEPDEAWRRFDALGADVVLVERPIPSWGRPPCFLTAYDRPTLSILLRQRSCSPEKR
jgi:hypothetical protein